MLHRTRRALAPLAVLAGLASAAPLRAQVTEVARTSLAEGAQLTFGHLCDDRFVVRNEGTSTVALAYGLEKGAEHVPLTLGPRESVELESRSKAAMELWMNGSRIAVAEKEKRKCRDVQGSGVVAVAPLEVATRTSRRTPAYGAPYPAYDPWFSGAYGYGYGGLGWRSAYYAPIIRYPVIVRGGRGRGGHRR